MWWRQTLSVFSARAGNQTEPQIFQIMLNTFVWKKSFSSGGHNPVSSIGRLLDCELSDMSRFWGGEDHFRCDW